MRTAALVAFLVALLVGTLLAGIYLWWSLSDVEISIHGLIAMTLGCLVTLALGGGLLFLVFYSNRHGHDDKQHGGPPSQSILNVEDTKNLHRKSVGWGKDVSVRVDLGG